MNPRYAWLRQLIAFAILLAVWEAAGRADLLNPLFVPMPSKITFMPARRSSRCLDSVNGTAAGPMFPKDGNVNGNFASSTPSALAMARMCTTEVWWAMK